MDGIKNRQYNSLKTRLSYWISSAILFVAIIAASFTFTSAFEEAHELQDDVLLQMATLFDRYSLSINNGNSAASTPSQLEFKVTVQLLGHPPSVGDLALPEYLSDGFHTVILPTHSVRVFVKTLALTERIAIIQDTAIRDEIAYETALHTLMPLLVLIPILILLLSYILQKIFTPIRTLADEVNNQSEHNFSLISTQPLPNEIVPFVEAINGLLTKNRQVIANQKRFIADAAHELRSPITALSLQAQLLEQTQLNDDARQKLSALQAGIERSIHLLEQLLSLARQQGAITEQPQIVSLKAVFIDVIEDLYPLIEAKRIDIGFNQDNDAQLIGSVITFKTLIQNLIDNAIRYSPIDGKIDLNIVETSQYIRFTIRDTGPGISSDELPKVFEPFYRVLGSGEQGSGLGLAIVANILQQMNAKITLSAAASTTDLAASLDNNTGLLVEVTFEKHDL